MNTEAHKKSLRESIDVIEESIRKGISERQKTIGFHCSSGAIDMMEMLLHKENLVSPGFIADQLNILDITQVGHI